MRTLDKISASLRHSVIRYLDAGRGGPFHQSHDRDDERVRHDLLAP